MKTIALCALVLGVAGSLVACNRSPTEPTELNPGGEHGFAGGLHNEGDEGRGGESGEGRGGESGESGTQYGRSDTAHESRAGVDLVMRYEAARGRFEGTVTNTTSAAVDDVRVEIHLSNRIELGPTPRVTLVPGEVRQVELDARGQTFQTWSVHVEIGPGT